MNSTKCVKNVDEKPSVLIAILRVKLIALNRPKRKLFQSEMVLSSFRSIHIHKFSFLKYINFVRDAEIKK